MSNLAHWSSNSYFCRIKFHMPHDTIRKPAREKGLARRQLKQQLIRKERSVTTATDADTYADIRETTQINFQVSPLPRILRMLAVKLTADACRILCISRAFRIIIARMTMGSLVLLYTASYAWLVLTDSVGPSQNGIETNICVAT